MSIHLSTEAELLIQKELEAGHFPDIESLVDTALRHYVLTRELNEDYTRDELEAKLASGIASLNAGEGVDGDAFMSQLMTELDAAEQRRK
jgi:antitoxin ParD1/3/4